MLDLVSWTLPITVVFHFISIQFYPYNALNNGHWHETVLQKLIHSGYKVRIYKKFIPNEQVRANSGKEKLPETTEGRNPERNEAQKGTSSG